MNILEAISLAIGNADNDCGPECVECRRDLTWVVASLVATKLGEALKVAAKDPAEGIGMMEDLYAELEGKK